MKSAVQMLKIGTVTRTVRPREGSVGYDTRDGEPSRVSIDRMNRIEIRV